MTERNTAYFEIWVTDTLTDTLTATTTPPPFSTTITPLVTVTETLTVVYTPTPAPVCESGNVVSNSNWAGGVNCDSLSDCSYYWLDGPDNPQLISLYTEVTSACNEGVWWVVHLWESLGECSFTVLINDEQVDSFSGAAYEPGESEAFALGAATWKPAEPPTVSYYAPVSLEFLVDTSAPNCTNWAITDIGLMATSYAYGT